MVSEQITALATQLLSLLAVIPGLWIAGCWLPTINGWLDKIGAGSITSGRAGQLILWLALGTLCANPLQDLPGLVVQLVRLGVVPASQMGRVSTVWGTAPFAVYAGLTGLTTILVYAQVMWAGYQLWRSKQRLETEPTHSLSLGGWFVLLTTASLINHLVSNVVFTIVWLPVPNSLEMGMLSSVGLLGAWLLGLAVFAVILVVLLNRIGRGQAVQPS